VCSLKLRHAVCVRSTRDGHGDCYPWDMLFVRHRNDYAVREALSAELSDRRQQGERWWRTKLTRRCGFILLGRSGL
jgi:hypothetical protein